MIKGNDITRQALVDHLTKGFCKVQFRKQSTGRFRSLVCTLNPNQIPAKYAKGAVKSVSGGENPDLLPVFDMVSRDWKSFYIKNVLYFQTEDELRGQNTNLKQDKGEPNAKRTENRRKAQAPKAKRSNKAK